MSAGDLIASQVTGGRTPSVGNAGTLVVSNVCVVLGNGRKYERGHAIAAGHPDAAELKQLGVVRAA